MAKKSAARIQRDLIKGKKNKAVKALENNNSFGELNGIYADSVKLLLSHQELALYTKYTDLMAEISDKPKFTENMQLLVSDLQAMSAELAQIHAQHAGKDGGTKDPDVAMKCIAIFEQYHLFMERHQAVVMPTVAYIVEQIDQAEKILLGKTAAAIRDEKAVTDVNVVTDVAFEETSKV
jgi:hypothetical protein